MKNKGKNEKQNKNNTLFVSFGLKTRFPQLCLEDMFRITYGELTEQLGVEKVGKSALLFRTTVQD